MSNGAEHLFTRFRQGTGLKFDHTGYWTYPAFVPAKKDEINWLLLILKAVPLHEKKRTALFRPSAMVLTEAGTGLVLSYDNFRHGHDPFPSQTWNKPVAMFPHKSIANMDYTEFHKEECRLMSAYETAGEQFATDGTLPQMFVDLYLRLTHPIVLPYLKHLAPAFFKTLGLEK